MRRYLVEFIGTFFLVLSIACTVNADSTTAILSIGTVLIAMIYAGAQISGAHFNPAVTMVMFHRKLIKFNDVTPYIITQIIAAVSASLFTVHIFEIKSDFCLIDIDVLKAISAEILGTFALCWVILLSATTEKNMGNSFYGLAIGFVVMGCIWSLSSWSGGYFNPAAAIGGLISCMTTLNNIFIIIAGNLIGAMLASFAFGYVYEKQK